MKKHTLHVFLLVLLVIPLIPSCSSNKKSRELEATNTPTVSVTPFVTSTPTPKMVHIATVYPTATSEIYYYNSDISALKRLGFYDKAIAEINSNTIYELDPFTYIDLCLESALHGKAAEVLPTCDLAVQKFPEYEEALYARGIARSQTGDYEGAISDFEVFLEKINTTQEKKYNTKTFRFDSNIHLFEYRINEWIDVLMDQQNPIKSTGISTIPGFKFTNIFTSYFDEKQIEKEQRVLLKYRYYESAMNSFYQYFYSYLPFFYLDEEVSGPEQIQMAYLTNTIYADLYAYSTVCINGCFAGDMDKVSLYCEKVDQIYQSIPENIDPEGKNFFMRRATISTGVFLVYQGDYESAKTFFEDYLLWQNTSELINNSAFVYDPDIKRWIYNLGKNQFPFTQEDTYFFINLYPWY